MISTKAQFTVFNVYNNIYGRHSKSYLLECYETQLYKLTSYYFSM